MKTNILKTTIAALACSVTLSADSVMLSKDKLGDFLISPLYIAKNNVCSTIKVMNTNETSSFLAKVAIREQISSHEVDFPIFLSPGDVWDGTICEHNGRVLLTSNDDSNHPRVMNILHTGKDLNEQSRLAGYKNVDFSKGYVEIYPIAQYYEGSSAKVQKSVLVKRWDALAAGSNKDPKLSKNGADSNSLSGALSFIDKNGLTTSTLPMTAFKGAHDRTVTGSAIAYSNDTNPDKLLGKNKKVQILKLLKTNKTSFLYDNSGECQWINFTFPFSYVSEQKRSYEITIRDMEENKHVETVIFSPRPVNIRSMKNEVVSISVEELIKSTNNPAKFTKGMIQIKDITNLNSTQLGKGKVASFIPVYTRTANTQNGDILIDSSYVPSK